MEEFLSFIADILEVDKSTLSLETSQDDVETWDSLMQLRLLGEIEAKYGVMIPMEQISTIKKLNDFYQYIKES
nr:acyl carrier protein [uncultured Roseburia sp.]